MNPLSPFTRGRSSLSILLILISLAELILAFHGPLVLTHSPSLLVMPLTTRSVAPTDDELEAFTEAIEAAFAGRAGARVKPQSLVAEYLLPEGRSLDEAAELDGALKLSDELGIQRLVEASMAGWGGELTLYLTLREASGGDRIAALTLSGTDLAVLTDKLTSEEFTSAFSLETPGLSLFDLSFLFFLALEVLLGLVLLFRPPRILNQALIILGSTLFLFALFYARNANMDYVQRFVAQSGTLTLAADTATEQFEVSLRFLPLLLVNLILYFFPGGGRHHPPPLFSGWLSGALYALAFPSLLHLEGIPLLSLVALVPLFIVVRGSSRGEAALAVMAFASVQIILINFWHATYSYVSLPFTVLLSLVQWLVFLPFFLVLVRRPGRSWILLVAAGWILFDWLRGMGFLAYPWGMLGTTVYPWIPFIQLASVTGVWGVSFALILFNAALTALLLRPKSWRFAGLAAGSALLIPLLFGGIILISAPAPSRLTRLLLVQHNRDPRKHDYAESLDALLRFSEEGLAAADAQGAPIELVVWPETAFVPDINFWMRRGNAGRPRRKLVERMFAAVVDWNRWLLTGTSDHTRLPGERDIDYPQISYNSTMLISPEEAAAGISGETSNTETYHKMVLVPFTEYFPFKEELPEVYAQLDKFDVSDWTPGEAYRVLTHPELTFATPICFEDIMPGHVRNFVAAGAEAIVNVSNDYWSLSPVEGMQHGVNALFRAVENRTSLVRATTSGLTMGIDPYGRILARLPFFEEGSLIVDLPRGPEKTSLYTRFGDWFPLLLCILLVMEFVGRLALKPSKTVEYRQTDES